MSFLQVSILWQKRASVVLALFCCLEKVRKESTTVTDKQKLFADEYLTDLNQTRAYKTAYPKVKNDNVAAAAASRLLKDNEIREYIDERLKEISDSQIADTEEVLQYLTSVVRREYKEYIVVTIMEETSKYVPDENGTMRKQTVKKEIPQIVEIPAKLSDSNKAAELLGRALGMYIDKLKVDDEAEKEKAQKLDNIASILSQMKPVKEGE